MDLIQRIEDGYSSLLQAPPCVARYRPIFWEPVLGTGESIVALIAVEPHEATEVTIASGTYLILQPDRLRLLLGRQRGSASQGVLREVADFLTEQQRAGLPVAELNAPFHGFKMAPVMVGRGYGIDQLLDAAVRSVSAFGRAEEMIEEEAADAAPRSTVRTSEFIRNLKRFVAGDDPDLRARFDKRMVLPKTEIELTVDYSYQQWLVQVTSLPATQKQFDNAQREAQSKLYEMQMLRDNVDQNTVRPVLLVNADVQANNPSPMALDLSSSMMSRLEALAAQDGFEIVRAPSPQEGAMLVGQLS